MLAVIPLLICVTLPPVAPNGPPDMVATAFASAVASLSETLIAEAKLNGPTVTENVPESLMIGAPPPVMLHDVGPDADSVIELKADV